MVDIFVRKLWRVFSAKVNNCILFFNKCTLYSSNLFCILSFAFSIVLSCVLGSNTLFVPVLSLCFDIIHCDDVTFFVTLRTQNLLDNLFPRKIYNYFSNMADNEISLAAADLFRQAANLLNPSNPSNQSSSNTARIVIEDTESEQALLTLLHVHQVQFTSPCNHQLSLHHHNHYLVNHQVVVYKILSSMRTFKDYLLLKIGKTIQCSRSNSYGQTGLSEYFKSQDTWTHDFICLANHEQRCGPLGGGKDEVTKRCARSLKNYFPQER